ncbi:phospholipase D family protein [Rhodococcus pyridinivorans]|uniref:phospholipase D family protein n=1 Tax=Rhodococcus pyridinivorans TaxID=103816 RepID=UPI0036837DAF
MPHVEFRFLDDVRTSHGKLIEWDDGTGTTALVGSANLTRAALLTTTRDGGNYELVAIHPVAQTLLPEGVTTVDATGMRARSTARSAESRGRIPLTLLGARWRDNEILIELHTKITGSIILEMSPTGAPGSWRRVDTCTAHIPGPLQALIRGDESTGRAVRARITEPDEYVTTVVFLTDVARCLPRDIDDDSPRVSRDYGIEDFITDPALADRLSNDLLRLMRTVGQHRTAAPPQRRPAQSPQNTRNDDRWGAWLERVQRTFSPTLAGNPRSIDHLVGPDREGRIVGLGRRWQRDAAAGDLASLG